MLAATLITTIKRTKAYLEVTLKLREVLLSRTRTPGAVEFLRPVDEWRRLLGLELHGTKVNTRATKIRQKVINEIQEILNVNEFLVCISSLIFTILTLSSPLMCIRVQPSIDLSNLQAIIPSWNGPEFPRAIPDETCREILAEIFQVAISFKFEVLLADRFLYELQPQQCGVWRAYWQAGCIIARGSVSQSEGGYARVQVQYVHGWKGPKGHRL
ncbi:hypothetical protein BT96DRAFT_988150 [Gymnopus androsaceus JB14]|uniref:Uncharacterized protein n=1 Tax=Gymnopus androsaceus JB14 TaxID=1447944 RepID=A0A6A4IA96_9AGAR|nr:hypothetical protein BT96DRAFT_988150 [Gymnopus androsaceus JB14]